MVGPKINNKKLGPKLKLTHTLANVSKEKLGNLWSAGCNEVWNRIKDKENKVGATKHLLQCKIKIRNSKEAYKNVKDRNKRNRSWTEFPTYTEFEEVLGYKDDMKIPEFYQVGVDNKETVTMNYLRLRKEDREIREKMRIMSKFSFYFVSKFSCVNFSSCVSLFSPCWLQKTGAFPFSFRKIITFF